jgi:hypothetical protein
MYAITSRGVGASASVCWADAPLREVTAEAHAALSVGLAFSSVSNSSCEKQWLTAGLGSKYDRLHLFT